MKKGIALILVISILTVVAITVVSFIFTMRLESRAAANYLWQKKAGYITEAGITHAVAVLKEDKESNLIDTYDDAWRSTFSGNDIDNNDDGTEDSRWIEIASGEEEEAQVIGRYAVLVEDESAKININTAGFHNESPLRATQGASPFEVSLKDFFSAQNISPAQNKAKAIIEYRYGNDQHPGEEDKDDNLNKVSLANDGIDNDADGEVDEVKEGIDEPEEFRPNYPYSDDRPFLTTEQIKRVGEVSSSDYNKIKSEITAYSQTASTDRNRDLQWDLNSIDVQQLLDVFLRSGVSSAWQKVVNLVDFVDSDFAQSLVVKSSLPLSTTNQGPNGDWQWQGDHYESKTYGGLKGSWSWTDIAAGEYFLFLHGTGSGQYIGDVTFGELTQTHLRSGETFSVFPSGTIFIEDTQGGKGTLTVAIQNNESLGTTCYFKYIELVSAEGRILGETEELRGTEGIRINEVMARPIIELVSSSSQTPGGDWSWQDGHYENAVSGGGAYGQGTWIWEDIPDGEYYLTVYAAAGGQVVGDVEACGATEENMHSGDLFSARQAVTVSGGIFRLDIRNNSSGSCYFKSVILSQQPDAEYIELVNLTPNDVSLDGFRLEVSGTDGWPATIPLGSSIGAGEYLILAVDKEDSCAGIDGNGISFADVWGELPAVQLDFTRSVTSYSDMIADQPAQGLGEIILRDVRGNIVDIQEYSSSQISPYVSLERGDPTCIGDVTDIWFASLDLTRATPASKNNNDEIIERAGDEIIEEHDLDEVGIKNRPLANLGEIARVTTGNLWEKMGVRDLMSVADKLSVYSLRLEAEEHKESDQTDGWLESLRSAPQTAWFISQNGGEEEIGGTWLWDEDERLLNGVYNLYLYGETGEALAISLHLADQTWTSFTPPLAPGVNKGVYFGRIEIGTQNSASLPAHKLEMRVKNVSSSGTAHFDYIRLAPLPYVAGKININTASKEVLQALPMIDEPSAQRIIDQRPLGNKEDKDRGIGDVLFEDILDDTSAEKIAKFSAISNLITVRSDTYQIIATGQALRNGRVMAEKRIRVVIER